MIDVSLYLYGVEPKRHKYTIVINRIQVGQVTFQTFNKECKKRFVRIRFTLSERLTDEEIQAIYEKICFLLENKELHVDMTKTIVVGNNSKGVEKMIKVNELEYCNTFINEVTPLGHNDMYYFINPEKRYGL